MLLTEEDKNNIYSMLADSMLVALEAGNMDDSSSQESAEYILSQLEIVSNKQELLTFLENLSSIWPQYKEVFLKIKSEEIEKQDNTLIQKAQEQLKTLQP